MTSTHCLRHLLCRLTLALICSACAQLPATAPPPPTDSAAAPAESPSPPIESSKAQLALAAGIADYENGSYKLAARQIQSALALNLPDAQSRAQAHKYLAFMHCVGGRSRLCREEFGKAIDADNNFDLTPAEAGHPTWGPVFRKLKASSNPSGEKHGHPKKK
jgi:Tfp pilus assembly protein PilF